MIRYVCDRCHKEVKEESDLFNIRRFEKGDKSPITESRVPDLCVDCVSAVFVIVNMIFEEEEKS